MHEQLFGAGELVEIVDDIGTPVEGSLFRVTEASGDERLLRQLSPDTKSYLGVAVRCCTAELITARPQTLQDYPTVPH